MAKVGVISRYFGFSVGGAEFTVLEMLKKIESEGNEIVAFMNADPHGFNANKLRKDLPVTWDIRPFRVNFQWTKFLYIEYFSIVVFNYIS